MLGPEIIIVHAPDAKHWARDGVLKNDNSPTFLVNEMGGLRKT